jgi:hypothetical protein
LDALFEGQLEHGVRHVHIGPLGEKAATLIPVALVGSAPVERQVDDRGSPAKERAVRL